MTLSATTVPHPLMSVVPPAQPLVRGRGVADGASPEVSRVCFTLVGGSQ
jgi:hypothetical protein